MVVKVYLTSKISQVCLFKVEIIFLEKQSTLFSDSMFNKINEIQPSVLGKKKREEKHQRTWSSFLSVLAIHEQF